MITQSEKTTSPKLLMGNLAPILEVKTLNGTIWKLADQTPKNYTMVVFYRGLHCPICQQYISDLEQKLDDFQKLGVEAIAISGDSLEKAQQFQQQANIQNINIGYDITPDEMRRWGLYLTKGHFESEPALFSEPAVFLIKPDNLLYFANIGTHPFSRVDFGFLLQGLEYIIPRNYPFRGTEWA
ncbi:redoxin domain-containing protein [Nostoc sp. FACHB-87]|uniref:redoxin domain-containing protein n=1 Tax=Nostocaceae TaxID=1162 RepID=UPI0016830AC8|nr:MULTISPECIES: redoxin domain-containing protein [Nostocaceae]MBD2459328.1 redoxin domain-containing protein [Nostoc sp. FACHB-87]MBD2480329.1 redoxin domain-containing protein [Anabaena sp. FACHB-83]